MPKGLGPSSLPFGLWRYFFFWLEGFWGYPQGRFHLCPEQLCGFCTLISLLQHSPLPYYLTENWLRSKCSTSVILLGLEFPSWHQPLIMSIHIQQANKQTAFLQTTECTIKISELTYAFWKFKALSHLSSNLHSPYLNQYNNNAFLLSRYPTQQFTIKDHFNLSFRTSELYKVCGQ